MKVKTSQFGEIEVQAEEIFKFPNGLPGFEQKHDYIIIQQSDTTPFSFLQSISGEENAYSFIITDPFLFFSDYEFELPPHVLEELKVEKEADIMIWSIVSIRKSISDATINLLAPIILNVSKKLGKQIVLHDSNYRTKHNLISNHAQAAKG